MQFRFFINIFSFFGFLSCFLFEISFSYLCVFFLILSYVFCSTSLFLVSKTQVEKHIFLIGVQHKVFFFSTCVLQNVKSYRFWGGHFFCKFLVVLKKHNKNRHLAHFSKQKYTKKMTFLEVIIWSKLEVIIWSKLGAS